MIRYDDVSRTDIRSCWKSLIHLFVLSSFVMLFGGFFLFLWTKEWISSVWIFPVIFNVCASVSLKFVFRKFCWRFFFCFSYFNLVYFHLNAYDMLDSVEYCFEWHAEWFSEMWFWQFFIVFHVLYVQCTMYMFIVVYIIWILKSSTCIKRE